MAVLKVVRQPKINDVQRSIPRRGAETLPATFDYWIAGRRTPPLGTNAGTDVLAFQNWRRFKEAFAPEIVRRAVSECGRNVRRCLDPFGGSGTTALACQFLGIKPVTVEVNPYLADLVEAKLATYDPRSIARDFARLLSEANKISADPASVFAAAPPTFVEPGSKGRWIFDEGVAARLASFRVALRKITNPQNARLFRVLLGGVLVDVSNVVISGKGRRYRSGWQKRRHSPIDLDDAFCRSVESAVGDIVRHGDRLELGYEVLRGDARNVLAEIEPVDLVVFSPPYPNSFDYTDVYNVELWGLGYLLSPEANRSLRLSTLASHVQVKRDFAGPPKGSSTLVATIAALNDRRSELWDAALPNMVGAYFADMQAVVRQATEKLTQNGEIWMVVGDSQYAGVQVAVSKILVELAPAAGCRVIREEPFRSMRASVQQGGHADLAERLLVLRGR